MMMEDSQIDSLCRKYARQELWLTVSLSLIFMMVVSIYGQERFLIPTIVGALFSLFVSYAEAFVWRWVAGKHPDNLPTFYTATSGFRMLLALVVMFVYYLVAGREYMMDFFFVFIVFYLILLVHTSIYFARLSRRL